MLTNSSQFAVPVAKLVTGVVVAVLAEEVVLSEAALNDDRSTGGRMSVGGNGHLAVYNMWFPSFPPAATSSLPRSLSTNVSDHRFVCFVSGLWFGDPDHNPLPTQMCIDFLSGMVGELN